MSMKTLRCLCQLNVGRQSCIEKSKSSHSYSACKAHPMLELILKFSFCIDILTSSVTLILAQCETVNLFSQVDIFKRIFLMRMLEFQLKFHWSFFPRVQFKISEHWFWLMAWHCTGDKPLPEPKLTSSLMHICGTRRGMSSSNTKYHYFALLWHHGVTSFYV